MHAMTFAKLRGRNIYGLGLLALATPAAGWRPGTAGFQDRIS
jgi:hypothetical protein